MIFDELEILYNEIDGDFSIKEFNARSSGLANDEFEIALKREHNDQAYFLFIFTRLEKRIQDLFDILVNNKTSTLTDGKELNSWRLVKKKRLELMDKVSYFAVPGGTDYNLIYDYKKKRDEVAHGDIASGVNISAVLIDMKKLYNDLDN
jgi:hypothetical protein